MAVIPLHHDNRNHWTLEELRRENRRLRRENQILEQIDRALRRFASRMEAARTA